MPSAEISAPASYVGVVTSVSNAAFLPVPVSFIPGVPKAMACFHSQTSVTLSIQFSATFTQTAVQFPILKRRSELISYVRSAGE